MAEDTGKKPIIVKKIKKGGGHGHHGGAWKVAYADFVTAMMAFFLLMWLLNATESEKLAGLADYFSPTVGVKDKMGIGFRGGQGPISQGIGADTSTNKGIVFGGVPSGPVVKVPERLETDTDEPDAEKVVVLVSEKAEEILPQHAADLAEEVKKGLEIGGTNANVDLKEIIEGLEIQIRDKEGRAMFDPGSAELRADMHIVLGKITNIIEALPNSVSISGHTASLLYSGAKEQYSNWELAAERANAARRVMIKSGLQPERIAKIVSRADNDPVDASQPEAPVNDRVSIVLLRNSALPQHKRAAPEKVLLDSRDKEVKELIMGQQEQEQTAPLEEYGPKLNNSRLFDDKQDATDHAIQKELEKMPPASRQPFTPRDILNVPIEKKKPIPPKATPNARLFEDRQDATDKAIENELRNTPASLGQSLPPSDILQAPAVKKPPEPKIPDRNARLFDEKQDETDKAIEKELQDMPEVPGVSGAAPLEILDSKTVQQKPR